MEPVPERVETIPQQTAAMSLGPAGASLNPEQAENFEDVSARASQGIASTDKEKMEKQFAVKCPPQPLRPMPSQVTLGG